MRISRGLGVAVLSVGLMVGGTTPAEAKVNTYRKCSPVVTVHGTNARRVKGCVIVTVNTKTKRASMRSEFFAQWNGPGEGKIAVYERAIDFAPRSGSKYCNPPRYFDRDIWYFSHMKTGQWYRIKGGTVIITAPKKVLGGCSKKRNYHPVHGSAAMSFLASDAEAYVDQAPRYVSSGAVKF